MACMIALKLFSSVLAGHDITVFIDNESVVSMLNSGKGRDSVMLAIAREIWRLQYTYNFTIVPTHIPSIDNSMADHLSHYYDRPHSHSIVDSLSESGRFARLEVDPYLFHVPQTYIAS
jgi:hypothetical protein